MKQDEPITVPEETPDESVEQEANEYNSGEQLLRTQGLVKSYRKRRVVNKVDITVNRGEIVGLLGKNGAGKTTTFYMTVGLVQPDEGRVFFKGEDITDLPIYKRARLGMGYLSQEPSVFRNLTVEQNVEAIVEIFIKNPRKRRRKVHGLLSDLNILHVSTQKAYTLSGGEKRRLEICRALVTSPSFIMLDEPFSGVDPIAVFDVQQILRDLKDKGIGILFTDHSVRETLSIVDRAYIINEGVVECSGSSEELINDPMAKKIYLGEQFTM
jgi:lipopolysaccharide export system ATP-binding protein